MLRSATAALCALLLSSCASITTGQNQTVSVETPLCPAVTCRLVNKDGTFFVASTPGTVMVNRSCGDLTIQCSKAGETDYLMTVDSSVKAMAFGNLLFGGIIGVGVDAVTGAACEYPSLIPVPMDCRAPSVADAPIKDAVPEAVDKAAVALKCADPHPLMDGPDGGRFYTASCADHDIMLRCDDKGCKATEFKAG